MSLRTNPSRSLRRLLHPQSSKSCTRQIFRSGICIQCRQQLHGRAVRMKGGETSLGSNGPSGVKPSARRPAFGLPASFVAGQSRTLATIHNGKIILLFFSTAHHVLTALPVKPDDRGPMAEYDDRVATGRLKDDEHQRGQQPRSRIADHTLMSS